MDHNTEAVISEVDELKLPNWPAISPALQPLGTASGGQGTGILVSLASANGGPAVEQLFPVTGY